jgi:hypothetical protein
LPGSSATPIRNCSFGKIQRIPGTGGSASFSCSSRDGCRDGYPVDRSNGHIFDDTGRDVDRVARHRNRGRSSMVALSADSLLSLRIVTSSGALCGKWSPKPRYPGGCGDLCYRISVDNRSITSIMLPAVVIGRPTTMNSGSIRSASLIVAMRI